MKTTNKKGVETNVQEIQEIANKFSVNLENASYKDSKKSLSGGMIYYKKIKVNKGAVKTERTTISASGNHVKYEMTAKNNKGELFSQKIESYSFDNSRRAATKEKESN